MNDQPTDAEIEAAKILMVRARPDLGSTLHTCPAIPIRWALVFAITLAMAIGAAGLIAGHLLVPGPNPRYFVDEREIKVPGEIPVWSVRYIVDGQVYMIQVEGTDNKDRFLFSYLGVRR